MALSAESVTVATTATQLASGPAGIPDQSVAVKVPAGAVTVYVGAADVDTTDGFPVDAGESLSVNLESGEVLYGIVASGTQAVNVLRAGA